jgi:23S rRNA (uridine2552-2'-O)-methyltransferase
MPQKFQRIKKARSLTKSSHQWLLRQVNDPFVERAKKEGLRCRAGFKIQEIDQKFKIFKKGKVVLDLGAAPGGWSQIAVEKVGAGNVIALDILDFDPLPGVVFLKQDFLADDAVSNIEQAVNKIRPNQQKVDILLSDMASNTTGDVRTDHLRIIDLLESSLSLAEKILSNNGCFVGKIFQGGNSNEIVKSLQQNFSTVKYFKPESSRKDSAEIYLVALGFKKNVIIP